MLPFGSTQAGGAQRDTTERIVTLLQLKTIISLYINILIYLL